MHLIKLKPDGSGKGDIEPNKITIGSPDDWPIALVPPNDMGALCIGEGLETVLAAVQQPELPEGTSFGSSMGAWATGGASRLPKLATAIAHLPFIEWVTICRESEPKAYAAANELAQELKRQRRDIEIDFSDAERKS